MVLFAAGAMARREQPWFASLEGTWPSSEQVYFVQGKLHVKRRGLTVVKSKLVLSFKLITRKIDNPVKTKKT